MKSLQRVLLFVLLLSSSNAFSATYGDTNKIFNLLEELFPELLAPTQTRIVDGICLRHYPKAEIYTAVICEDKGIYPFKNLYILISSKLHDLGNINQYRELYGNQSDSDGNANVSQTSAGNGNCVNVPLPKAGSHASYTVTSDFSIGTQDITFHNVNSTLSVSTNTTSDSSGFSSTSEITQNYHIIDNFRFIDSIINTSSSSYPGFDSPKTKFTNTFSPTFNTGPILVYCEQQSWNTGTITRTSMSETIGATNDTTTNTSTSITSGVVEAVNDIINTNIGSFNTVRVRETSEGTDTLTWYSIEHGFFVKMQMFDINNQLIYNYELDSVK